MVLDGGAGKASVGWHDKNVIGGTYRWRGFCGGRKAGLLDRARRFVAGMRVSSITVLSKYFYSVSRFTGMGGAINSLDPAERSSSQIFIIIFLWLQHGA